MHKGNVELDKVILTRFARYCSKRRTQITNYYSSRNNNRYWEQSSTYNQTAVGNATSVAANTQQCNSTSVTEFWPFKKPTWNINVSHHCIPQMQIKRMTTAVTAGRQMLLPIKQTNKQITVYPEHANAA